MRYWIWWNDLVQGPFEIHELRSLSAFTAELLVCEETRQDWVAVGTVPELGYYLHVRYHRRATPARATVRLVERNRSQ